MNSHVLRIAYIFCLCVGGGGSYLKASGIIVRLCAGVPASPCYTLPEDAFQVSAEERLSLLLKEGWLPLHDHLK